MTPLRQRMIEDMQLQALHARSVAVGSQPESVASANEFITYLDRLRVMDRTDANAFAVPHHNLMLVEIHIFDP